MVRNPRNTKTVRTGERETSFVVDSSTMYSAESAKGSGALEHWEGAEAKFTAMVNKMTSAMQSATEKIEYIGASAKQRSESTGYERQELFVKAPSGQDAYNAMSYTVGKTAGKGEFKDLANQGIIDKGAQYQTLEVTRQIVGKENKALLDQLAKQNAFSVEYSKQKGFEDFATIRYRGEEQKLAQYEAEHNAYVQAKRSGAEWTGDRDARLTAEARIEKDYFGDVFRGSDKAKRKQEVEAEAERIAKVNAQNEKYGEKYTSTHQKYSDLIKDRENLTPDELLTQYKDIERQDKERREEGAQEREQKANSRKTVGAFAKVISIVTILTDLVRRILTSVMDATTQARADSISANALGLSYYQKKTFDHSDMAHGLKEGTTMNAISDLQSKFGDVTNLDEKSLEVLARVMGGEVSKMVRSGMGGETPDKLLSAILNKYFESFKQGKNSLGQNVGQDQALRELTTVLGEVSPAIAEIFSTMAVQWKSGVFKGRFDNYEEFLGTTQMNRGGLTDTEINNFVMLGDVVNMTKDAFLQIKETLLTKVANGLTEFLSKLEDSRLGESAEQQVQHNMENREKLQKSLEVDAEKMEIDRMAYASALKSETYKEFSDVTLEDIKKYRDVRPETLSGAEAQKATNVRALLSRASLSEDQNMFAHIAQYLATDERMEESNRQLAKRAGNVEYLESVHTDEGKALTDRNMMLALRQGVMDEFYGSTGVGVEEQIKRARTDDGTVDLSKLDSTTLEFIRGSMGSFYKEYGTKGLYNVDEQGNVSFDPSQMSKSWLGNYNNPQLEALVENFNAMVGEKDQIKTSMWGGIKEEGMSQLIQILTEGERAKRKYTNAEGVVDEEAFKQDKSYKLYNQLKQAELAGFADLMTSTGFGEQNEYIQSIKKSAEAQTAKLQEQAELLTKTNSSLTSVGSTVNAIEELLRQQGETEAKGGYFIQRLYGQGDNTREVKVAIILKDEQGRVINKQQVASEWLSAGATFSGEVTTEIDASTYTNLARASQ